jgi:hypothetical protein
LSRVRDRHSKRGLSVKSRTAQADPAETVSGPPATLFA